MTETSKRGFRIVAAGRVADIYLYDAIGDGGITADAFRRELEALGDVDLIRMYVHSPGGSVFDGWAIHGLLMRHPAKLNVTIDGICASMATLIVCAADRVDMREGALYMIHAPYDANDPEATDDPLLREIKETMISAYANRTGLSPLKLRNMMTADGTWMTAAEAHRLRFVDSVISLRVAACAFDLKAFGLPDPPSAEPAAAPVAEKEPDLREGTIDRKNRLYGRVAK